MKAFQDAKVIVNLMAFLMIILPMIISGIIALKWHFYRKSQGN